MNRKRISALVILSSTLFMLLFIGAQFQVPAVFALPSFTSSSVATPATNTCAGCHSGAAASGGSAVVVFPSGTSYTPGVTQHLSVKVTDPTHARGGFLLTARLASSVSSQAGNFAATDANTTVVANGAVQDIEAASFSTLTWNFDWTPPATSAGSVTFFLTGLATGSPGTTTSGNGVYQSTATLTPAATATPDFSLAASPTSVSVAQGSSGASTITITPSNGFTGTVNLSASGLPSGVTAAFSPSSTTKTSSLTLTAGGTAATGTSTVTITGTSGALTHTTTVSLTVTAAAPSPNFTLSASPSSLAIAQGASGTSTIIVTASNGFTGSVAFSAQGLPSGVTASFASNTLTLAASSTAATGTSTVTITGTSGALTHTTSVSLTVNATTSSANFTLSASPSSLTITPGSSGSTNLTITPSGGFNSGSVTFTPPGLPSGLTATFGPISSTGTSTLTFSASSTAAPIAVGVTITGTAGTLTHTTLVSVTVAASSGTGALTLTPTSLNFKSQGGSLPPSQSLTVSTPKGPMPFTASVSGGTWLSASPASGTAPGSVKVSVNPAHMPSGTFSGMITLSTSGAKDTSVPVTLTVTSAGCVGDCEGVPTTIYAQPYVYDPNSTGTVTAVWVDGLGMPTSGQRANRDPGLVLAKNATAPTGTLAGAIIKNVTGSLTELGFDYREGGQCTATSPRFIVVTSDNVTHVVGGCSKGTTTAAPVTGWNRVRFNLSDTAQTSPAITPGEQASSITLVLDLGPEGGPTAAGGLVVIDDVDINGQFVDRGAWLGRNN